MEEIWGLKTISFNSNGGTSIPDQKLMNGETVRKPNDPAKVNSVFIGWFDANDNIWNFNTVPDRNMTLYAKWSGLGITLSHANPHVFDTLEYGYALPPPLSLTVTNSGTMPTGDLTVTLTGNVSAFNVTSTLIPNLVNQGDEYSFPFNINQNLTAGTYTAIITISNGSNITAYLNLSFTVVPQATVWIDITGGTQNIPFVDLKSALDSINTAGTYTVRIGTDQLLTSYTRQFPSASDITLKYNENTPISVILDGTGSLFTINNGVTFRLDNNVTLQGNNSFINNAALIHVNGGNLYMNDNAVITDNFNQSGSGGGVYINSGTFNMTGGTMSKNSASLNGGGVYIAAAGNFVKTGGIIYGEDAVGGNANLAASGSAVYHASTIAKTRTNTSGSGHGMNSENAGVPGGWDPIPFAGTISITGLPEVGQTLTANISALIGTGTFTYQWLSNGSPLAGQTNNTYNITAAAQGANISVTVASTHHSNTVTSGSVTVAMLPATYTGLTITRPVINPGTAETVASQTFYGSGAAFSATVQGDNNPIQTVTWSISGTDITSSINNGVLTVSEADHGKQITVTATSTVIDTIFNSVTVIIVDCLPSKFFGAWINETDEWEPYTITISNNNLRWEDEDGDGVNYSNPGWIPGRNMNGMYSDSYSNGYSFTGHRTIIGFNEYLYEDIQLGFFALSSDGFSLYLGINSWTANFLEAGSFKPYAPIYYK
ncbi:MAG: InlB B-repeat-containing protein [Treponema sp.]|nr:InlB B-repeat-containing protein [Treponema sp.]